VRGVVQDRAGRPVGGALVVVAGISRAVTTTAAGEYWRILKPGHYTVRAEQGGSRSREQRVEVRRDQHTVINLTLP